MNSGGDDHRYPPPPGGDYILHQLQRRPQYSPPPHHQPPPSWQTLPHPPIQSNDHDHRPPYHPPIQSNNHGHRPPYSSLIQYNNHGHRPPYSSLIQSNGHDHPPWHPPFTPHTYTQRYSPNPNSNFENSQNLGVYQSNNPRNKFYNPPDYRNSPNYSRISEGSNRESNGLESNNWNPRNSSRIGEGHNRYKPGHRKSPNFSRVREGNNRILNRNEANYAESPNLSRSEDGNNRILNRNEANYVESPNLSRSGEGNNRILNRNEANYVKSPNLSRSGEGNNRILNGHRENYPNSPNLSKTVEGYSKNSPNLSKNQGTTSKAVVAKSAKKQKNKKLGNNVDKKDNSSVKHKDEREKSVAWERRVSTQLDSPCSSVESAIPSVSGIEVEESKLNKNEIGENVEKEIKDGDMDLVQGDDLDKKLLGSLEEDGFGEGHNRESNRFEPDHRNSLNSSRAGEGNNRILNRNEANYVKFPNLSRRREGNNRILNGYGENYPNYPNLSEIVEGYSKNSPNSSKNPGTTIKAVIAKSAKKRKNKKLGNNVDKKGNSSVKHNDEREKGVVWERVSTQLDSPCPPAESAIPSVSGIEVEESKLNKNEIGENVEKEIKDGDMNLVQGDLDDLDKKILGSLEEDGFGEGHNRESNRFEPDHRNSPNLSEIVEGYSKNSPNSNKNPGTTIKAVIAKSAKKRKNKKLGNNVDKKGNSSVKHRVEREKGVVWERRVSTQLDSPCPTAERAVSSVSGIEVEESKLNKNEIGENGEKEIKVGDMDLDDLDKIILGSLEEDGFGEGHNRALNRYEPDHRNSPNFSRVGEGNNRVLKNEANYGNSPNLSRNGKGNTKILNGHRENYPNSPNLSRIGEGYNTNSPNLNKNQGMGSEAVIAKSAKKEKSKKLWNNVDKKGNWSVRHKDAREKGAIGERRVSTQLDSPCPPAESVFPSVSGIEVEELKLHKNEIGENVEKEIKDGVMDLVQDNLDKKLLGSLEEDGFGEGHNMECNRYKPDHRNSPNSGRVGERIDKILYGNEVDYGNSPNLSRNGEGNNMILNGYRENYSNSPNFSKIGEGYAKISPYSSKNQGTTSKAVTAKSAKKKSEKKLGNNVDKQKKGNSSVKHTDEREKGVVCERRVSTQLDSSCPPVESVVPAVLGIEESKLHKNDFGENCPKQIMDDDMGLDHDDLDKKILGSLEEEDGLNDKKRKNRRQKVKSDTRGQNILAWKMRKSCRNRKCRVDIEMLNAPLLAIYESLIPPEEEKIKKKQLLSWLENLVIKEWPESRLSVYGSCANSFGLKNCDIDICLTMKDDDLNKIEVLLKLADIFMAEKLENVEALIHTRVPIVKLVDPSTGISCDICINNVLAEINSKLLRDYAKIDIRLLQLAFIVKHWAKSRGVNETYYGTLSSYAYVLMCIHFLQQCRPAILPCLQAMDTTYSVIADNVECAFFDQVEKLSSFGSRNVESIGQLVWGFFRYWAYCHDYAHHVISVRLGSIISKRDKDWIWGVGKDRHLFCIEDPFEITHDIGRVVDKCTIKILKEEFERAAEILQFDPNPYAKLFEPYVPR